MTEFSWTRIDSPASPKVPVSEKTDNTVLLEGVSLKILIVDDYELMRSGLRILIEGKSRHRIIGDAENASQCIELAQRLQPDIILMDINLPGMDGIGATRQIKKLLPGVKVIMLTENSGQAGFSAAVAAGASAYCLKDIKPERLIQVMEMVADGAVWFDAKIAGHIAGMFEERGDSNAVPSTLGEPAFSRRVRRSCDLTEREMDVLTLIAQGRSNKEIARELCITVHTVKIHVGNVIQKLDVTDRTQAAIKAYQEKLVVLSTDSGQL